MESVLLLLLPVIWASLFLPSRTSSILEEYNALRAFKQGIFEDPLYKLSGWNLNDEDPCDWTGISCSATRDHVININLASSSLRGFISLDLGSLQFLQELNLKNNFFIGNIPKEIGKLKNLWILDLSSNNLTGSIPPEIGGLASISKINLGANGLSGRLPFRLRHLRTLVELRLDRNKLESLSSGAGLCSLPKLTIGNFSYNFLAGNIPTCLQNSSRYNFQGNCLSDRRMPLQRPAEECGDCTPAAARIDNNSQSRTLHERIRDLFQQPPWFLSLEIVAAVISVIFLVVLVLVAVKMFCIDPSSSSPSPSSTIATGKKTPGSLVITRGILKNVARLSRDELEIACEDFSNIIGSSSDSVVYKGTMNDGCEIAVISLCISVDHWTAHLELYFQTEVANLARLKHENTAKLIGYCKESDPFTRMLVFEYASNGTLYENLHCLSDEGSLLSWIKRMKTAISIAQGLRYLHTEVDPPFILSDLRSSAVYFTEDFSPKLVDFESWKAVLLKAENSGYIAANGKTPFQDPIERTHMDVQGNTFSFGVILLEIITGRPPFCKDRGYLVDWATGYLEKPDMMIHLVDPNLRYFNHNDLRVLCNVVSLSIQSEPAKRPSMQVLAAMLEGGIETSPAAILKESPLKWAELALSSP